MRWRNWIRLQWMPQRYKPISSIPSNASTWKKPCGSRCWRWESHGISHEMWRKECRRLRVTCEFSTQICIRCCFTTNLCWYRFNFLSSVAKWIPNDIDQVFFNVTLCEFLESSCGILKLMISRLSAHWTARRNGHRLLILGWNALPHPGSYSRTFSHVPNCTRTRRISR